MMAAEDAGRTVDRHAPSLMEIPGVEAVAEGKTGDGAPCIRIFVSVDPRSLEGRLPAEIDGFPVHIERAGPFKGYGTGL
jgi:hypothetical protein